MSKANRRIPTNKIIKNIRKRKGLSEKIPNFNYYLDKL